MEMKRFLGQYLIWVILLLGQLHGCKSCIEKEREALLELKNDMISRSGEGYSDYILTTWTNDTKTDCCQWKGITCSHTTGRVIGLSLDDMYFNEISLLNLSLLHPFEEVRSLNLSGDQKFHGFFDDVEGYKSLRRLRNLKILDLSSNFFDNSIFPYLNAATSLTTLFLQQNNIHGHFSAKELKNLTNLEQLDLSYNYLNGSVSDFTHQLEKLKTLDLSSCYLSSSMEWKELNTNLEVLGLAHNDFDGPLPIEVVCKMKNLRELYLSDNYFGGHLPLCLGSLNKLHVLDLSSNQLSGNLPSSFSNLESLEYLSLLDNNFTGLFSLNPLTNLTKLMVFKLSPTSASVQVQMENTWQPKFQLSVVVLRHCSLVKIPSFLIYQKNLRLVDLSNNKLSGNIPTWLLVNNQELEVLRLRDNLFTIFEMPLIVHNLQVLDFSANNIHGVFVDNIGRALPNLAMMNGSHNGFQGNFSSSMGEMKRITILDMSHNNFSGELPRSFVTGCFSLYILILSHNKFSGHFLPRRTSFSSLEVMRMDNNLFTGKIGVGLLSSTKLSTLDMSKNCLAGVIPSWISKLSSLGFLLLSNNFLEGTLPPSLLVMGLSILDLSGNLLSGAVPPHGPSVYMSGKMLFLHNNNFTGQIPDTLLGNVQILDLRNNKLSGSIPQFVNTEDIRILLLSGNSLTGSIPRQLCSLSNIRLLDLSDNQLDGFIPSCLYNLSFGLGGEEMMVDYLGGVYSLGFFLSEFYKSTFLVEKLEVKYDIYQEIEIKFASKQRYESYYGSSEFNKGILGYLNGMDLSNNELSGVIPAELGDLSKLQVMNLSHNFLSSSIPSSFSKLKDIESLDLSHNMLQGSIPHLLTNLTSLAVFDVSYNNLSGIIPQGKQFNTFDANNYLGNPFLCGPPTNRSCEAKKSSDDGAEEDDDEAAIDMLVFYFTTASTYVTALICILAMMCFDCPWRRAWLRIVDASITSAKRILP